MARMQENNEQNRCIYVKNHICEKTTTVNVSHFKPPMLCSDKKTLNSFRKSSVTSETNVQLCEGWQSDCRPAHMTPRRSARFLIDETVCKHPVYKKIYIKNKTVLTCKLNRLRMLERACV